MTSLGAFIISIHTLSFTRTQHYSGAGTKDVPEYCTCDYPLLHEPVECTVRTGVCIQNLLCHIWHVCLTSKCEIHTQTDESCLRQYSLLSLDVLTFMALNGLLCADVPLRNYSLTGAFAAVELMNVVYRMVSSIQSTNLSFSEWWHSMHAIFSWHCCDASASQAVTGGLCSKMRWLHLTQHQSDGRICFSQLRNLILTAGLRGVEIPSKSRSSSSQATASAPCGRYSVLETG